MLMSILDRTLYQYSFVSFYLPQGAFVLLPKNDIEFRKNIIKSMLGMQVIGVQSEEIYVKGLEPGDFLQKPLIFCSDFLRGQVVFGFSHTHGQPANWKCYLNSSFVVGEYYTHISLCHQRCSLSGNDGRWHWCFSRCRCECGSAERSHRCPGQRGCPGTGVNGWHGLGRLPTSPGQHHDDQ